MTDKERQQEYKDLQDYIVYKIGFALFDISTKEEQQELLNKYGSMLSPEHLQDVKQRLKQ